jgi:hypothetical protein
MPGEDTYSEKMLKDLSLSLQADSRLREAKLSIEGILQHQSAEAERGFPFFSLS